MITSYIFNMIDDTREINKVLMWVYRFFPGFCLGHGLFEICSNSLLSTIGAEFGFQDKVDLLGWDVAGADVLYLYLTGPFYFAIAVGVDYLLHSPLAAAGGKRFDPRVADAGVDEETPLDVEDDEDVANEARRVLTSSAAEVRIAAPGSDSPAATHIAASATSRAVASTTDSRRCADIIQLKKLRKVYRTPEGVPKVAVQSLSFGLSRGECFGFLGINGAGKTSTLNMLTGAVLPSGGTALLGGHDIITAQGQVRRLLGYCPQHDALLDRLTVKEHLELFGRIKGIPKATLKQYCDAMMRNLSLEAHVDKMAMTLSGGNKRKLSLAIALMGFPPLALLDEPSTGVDPAARRLMWDTISSVSTLRRDCTVMLTTHNMEEAEALCSRIGIMVGGRLRCIGSNQHLKSRYGGGYQLEVRLGLPDRTRVDAELSRWGHTVGVTRDTLAATCAKLGKRERAESVREGCEEGCAIYDFLARGDAVPAHVFTEWWLLEDAAQTLGAFLVQRFPGAPGTPVATLLERHERTLRYSLPSVVTSTTAAPTIVSTAPSSPSPESVAPLSLAELFRCLEANRSQLLIEEYGISQTTLEQIFNGFAAQQEEHTDDVQGASPVTRQRPTSPSEVSMQGSELRNTS